MANPYFTRPASVYSGAVIRADKYNSDLDAQESAFEALHDKLQHAVFLPETFSGDPTIPEQTVENTFVYIDASGNIALYPIQTMLDQFELVAAQHSQVEAWTEQVAENALNAQESSSLSSAFANANEDIEVVSGLYSAKHWAAKAEAQIALVETAGQEKVNEAQAKVVEAEQAVTDAQEQVALATTQASNASTQASAAASSATDSDNFANYSHNQIVPNSGGKYSAQHWAQEAENYAQQTMETVNGDFVPNSRTVNGKALSSNIILAAADFQGFSTVATSGSYNDLNDIPADIMMKGSGGVGGASILAHNVKLDFTDVNDGVPGLGAWTNAAVGAPLSNSYGVVVGGRYFGDSGNGNDNDNQVFIAGTTSPAGRFFGMAGVAGTAPWLEFWTDSNLPNPMSIGDYGFGGRGISKANESIDTVSATSVYDGRGGAHVGESTGDNPFPDLNGAFSILNLKCVNDNGSEYFTQMAIAQSAGVVSKFKYRYAEAEIHGWITVWDSSNLPNPLQSDDVATVATTGNYNDLNNKPTASSLGAVPTSRKVNGKALTSDISLSAADVGALPDTQKAASISRASGSFTATKVAGISEYVSTSTSSSTCTVNSAAFSADDKLIIHKQYRSGTLTITAGVDMVLPDGTNATSHHIPDGYSGTIEMVFTATQALLRIYS